MSAIIAASAVGGGGGGSGYAAAVLADTPLVYWRQGDPSGSTMTDTSGNSRNGGYNGTFTLGTAGLITGDSDTALTLAGAGYGSLASAAWMNVNPFTLEMVIKPSAVGGGSIYLIWDRDGGTSGVRVFQFRINATGKLELIWWTSNGLRSVAGSTTLVAGTKYHVAATYDGANGKVWLNGTSDGTLAETGTTVTGTSLLVIGANSSASPGGSARFSGVLDEAAFYGAALSSTRLGVHAGLV